MLNEVTKENILYLNEDKKETDTWFQALGAQMPLLGGTKYGFIRRISHSKEESQVKNTEENIGTFDERNQDIRYSREMDTVKALERQNAIVKERAEKSSSGCMPAHTETPG